MAYDNVVLSFGCPRSGTTIMRRLLGPLKHTYVSKLHEATRLHPWQSEEGLLDIQQWMLKDTLVFVRTLRHPLDVVDSFLALRRTEMRENNPSLVEHDDQRVLDFIRRESAGFHGQRAELLVRAEERGWDHHVVEVRYEELDEQWRRDEFAWSVCRHLSTPERSYGSLTARMEEEWKLRPVRDGKLRAGITGRVMTEEEEQRWRRALADVMEREGYQ